MQSDTITLYYRDGSSDKVYQAAVTSQGDGFVVNFAFGRRGSTLQTGTKTQKPIEYHAAKKIYEKLISEKKAKGYTAGDNGTPYLGTDYAGRDSGIHCQLLNSVDELALPNFINDENWCFQEKFDGKRMLVRRTCEGVIEAINRKGLTIAIPAALEKAFSGIQGSFIFDGEVIGDKFFIFDILHYYTCGNDGDIRSWGYKDRLNLLPLVKNNLYGNNAEIVNTITTPQEKTALVQRLRAQNKEGIVIKRLDAPYIHGRPASGGDNLKYKFTQSLSAIVIKTNVRRSVGIGLIDDQGKVVEAGNVTIPSNFTIPVINSIVEVRYLYAHAQSGSLYQPIYLGVRDDIDRAACLTSQLKLKATCEEDES